MEAQIEKTSGQNLEKRDDLREGAGEMGHNVF